MESKKELRKLISMRKKQVPVEERRRRSVPVMERLMGLPRFRRAQNILFYWAMQDEVSTQDAVLSCAAAGKNVFLPVVDGEMLRIRRFSGRAALVPGESYSIPEPVEGSEEVRISDIDLVVVPGVAFDADGGHGWDAARAFMTGCFAELRTVVMAGLTRSGSASISRWWMRCRGRLTTC